MIPAKKEDGKRIGEPFDKITIKLDVRAFTRVQSAQMVRLRTYCPENGACADFLLKTMAPPEGGPKGGAWDLNLSLDEETFENIMNPRLKVIFQCSNVLAPFFSVGLAPGSLFAERKPLLETVVN
ncbi:MAG: hypothetical protein AB1529_05415 [Candidatus Micrarchaeota archaeon]